MQVVFLDSLCTRRTGRAGRNLLLAAVEGGFVKERETVAVDALFLVAGAGDA